MLLQNINTMNLIWAFNFSPDIDAEGNPIPVNTVAYKKVCTADMQKMDLDRLTGCYNRTTALQVQDYPSHSRKGGNHRVRVLGSINISSPFWGQNISFTGNSGVNKYILAPNPVNKM
jgi:hypothetical protein